MNQKDSLGLTQKKGFELQFVELTCWKCNNNMKVVYGADGADMLSPEHFSPEQTAEAERNGVKLGEKFSHTAGEAYVANLCPSCGAMFGDWFLRDLWIEWMSENWNKKT